MVNLRTRPSQGVVKVGTPQKGKAAVLRTSSRAQNKKTKYTDDDEEDEEVIEEDVDFDEKDLEIESSNEEDSSTVNDNREVNESEEEEDIELESAEEEGINSLVDREEEDISDDDREIRRIIMKTNAETQILHLTARQKAKSDATTEHGLGHENILLELPTSKPLTEEQVLNKSEKSRRRKMQRDAKIEENKRATIDRLLLKQQKPVPVDASGGLTKEESAAADKIAELASKELQPGFYRYIDSKSESILQFPNPESLNLSFPPTPPTKPETNKILYCDICKKNESKYKHPSNLKRFCSLTCYKLIK